MIADDVRTLIRQVERGNPFDVEWTGHAYDVRENMRNALAARLRTTALMGELEERIDRFARQSASTNMYMRLVIDDRMPDLPEYDPCNIAVFDGIRDSGTDFSKVIQRSTIYGTVMTSVNVTDLRAYFESGRKRHLLMYMGSDRDADIKALDKMMTALPTLMANAGVDAGTIKAVIEQIRSGGMTPEILKLVSTIVKIVELRAQPATPETKAEIQSMARDFVALMERALPALPPAFARAFSMVAVSPSGLAPVLPPAILPLLQDVVMKTSPVQSVAPSAHVVARVPAAPQAPATRPAMRASFARVAEVPAVLNVPRIVLSTPLKLSAPVRGDVVPATTSKTTPVQTAPATKSSGKIAAAIRAGFARAAAIPAVMNVARIILATPLSLTVPVSNQAKSLSDRPQSQIQKTQAVLTKSIDAAPRTAPAGKIATMMRAAFARTASVPAVLNVNRLILSVPLRFDTVRKSESTPAPAESISAAKGTVISRLVQNFARTSIAPAVLNVAKLALSTPLRLVAAPLAMREVMPSARNHVASVSAERTVGLASRFGRPAVSTGMRVTPQPFTSPIRFATASHTGQAMMARMQAAMAVPLAAAAVATATVPAAASTLTQSGANTFVSSRLETSFAPRETGVPASRRTAPAPANESIGQSSPKNTPAELTAKDKTVSAIAGTENGTTALSVTSKPSAETTVLQSQAKAASAVTTAAVTDTNTPAVLPGQGQVVNPPQGQPAGTDAKIAPEQGQPTTPQYDENGKLKRCCVGPFGEAVALKNFVEAVKAASNQPTGDNPPYVPPPRYEAMNTGTGDIIIVNNGTGEKTLITRQEVDRNIQDHARLDAELRAAAKPDRPVTWQDDTAEMLRRMAQPSTPEKEKPVTKYFNHICSAGCNHGHDHKTGFRTEAVEPSGKDVSKRGIDLTVVQAAKTPPEAEGKKTGSRPRRTLKMG